MMKLLMRKRRKKGFTLIELVVVIAILGILMSIAIPKLSGFRDNAAIKADQATAATIGQAIELYMLDDNEIEEKDISQTDEILEKLRTADLIVKDNCKPQYKDMQFKIIYNNKSIEISYDGNVDIGDKRYKVLYPKINPINIPNNTDGKQ